MTDGYLYRYDGLNALRAQAADPSLRARRVRPGPTHTPHHQFDQALTQAKPGQGVFGLSMWRGVEGALPFLASQLHQLDGGLLSLGGPLVLQRIRADHPMFQAYERGDDEHLSGKAWLFWKTESCTDEQEWSSDGIAHDDIEVFHPAGVWTPFQEWASTAFAPPPLAPGWTRIELAPLLEGLPRRIVEARWTEFPSGTDGPVRGIFARVPEWSTEASPDTRGLLSDLAPALVDAFPAFLHEGVLRMALELRKMRQVHRVAVERQPAARPSWFARTLLRAQRTEASVSLVDSFVMDNDVARRCYEAAGVDWSRRAAEAYIYGPEALSMLDGSVEPTKTLDDIGRIQGIAVAPWHRR